MAKNDKKNEYITFTHEKGAGAFVLSDEGLSAPLYIDTGDFTGVKKAFKQCAVDIGRVTGTEPDLVFDTVPRAREIVCAGTIGKSSLIDGLAEKKKIASGMIEGRWESFIIQTVETPFPGVERALVIAGSDQRGTIFGIYDLCLRIGVSPWYFWADVPITKRRALYVLPGCYTEGEPAVRYRGIFINDEYPALTKWANENFGGFTHRFYEKVFELILRLKGNFLWPAMWGHAFYDDDPANPKTAFEYGIVIGTSHHEPMMRAHSEWQMYGDGPWNYEKNEDILKKFWETGVKRISGYESIITVGMRGDGDEPMSKEANISLLEKIVNDQRCIISESTGRESGNLPQLWAIYKEVQEYYEKGMKIPDDVTMMFCDDNWGNIRKLPLKGEQPRSGGYGMYYHFDYVGAPRNYKWVNTSQITRTWEQMNLAYKYGVDRIWIVNVGDIKPMEFPAHFFLDHAWYADRWSVCDLNDYTRRWASRQFGEEYASEIADIISRYTMYNSRRKPELLSPHVYSLVNYREAETVLADYNECRQASERIYRRLPAEYKDAYYQLVHYMVSACANLNELYVAVAKNRLYARQGRASANDMADLARKLFSKDAEYTSYYNHDLSGGKWNHIMDQTHIGYISWQQPEINRLPDVKEITLPDVADMGVAIEGSEEWWPASGCDAVLPEFDSYKRQVYYIEIFNRGKKPFRFSVETDRNWLHAKPDKGVIETEQRVRIWCDWNAVPAGKHRAHLHVTGTGKKPVAVSAAVDKPGSQGEEAVKGFIEGNGYVSLEAEHYSRAVDTDEITWKCIPSLGRTRSAMTTFPVTMSVQRPGGESPRLEYRIYVRNPGDVAVRVYLSPTLDCLNTGGLCYAVSFDSATPQIVNIHEHFSYKAWLRMVSDNINVTCSRHRIEEAGGHVLKFWMVHPGIVLQKLVVETKTISPSYLGPPESCFRE